MIDFKELHIGSHIKFYGATLKVMGVDVDYDSDAPIIIKAYDRIRDCEVNIEFDEANPIPITPELLSELGFEYREHSNSWLYRLDEDNVLFVYNAAECGWKVNFYPQDYRMDQTVFVSSLHELESPFYHVFKKELIEE